MKKIYKLISVIIVFLILPCMFEKTKVLAVDNEEFYNQMLYVADADDIDTYSASEYLDEYDIDINNTDFLKNISIGTVFSAIKNIFVQQISMPIRLFSSTVGVVLFMTAVQSLMQSNGMCTLECKSVGTLVCVMILSVPICECIEGVCNTVGEGADFLSGLVPVFSSLSLFAGATTASCVYSSSMLSFCGFAANLSSMVLLPMLSCVLALSVVDSISPMMKLGCITNGIKKATITILCFLMVIFTGVLSLQTNVAASGDNVAIKAGRYIISSTIPIVGGAVSEAFNNINAGIVVMRNTVGAFGVIALAFIVIPMVAKLLLCSAALKVTELVADVFGVDVIVRLINAFYNVLTTALAVLVSFFVMSVISSTIFMTVLGG